MLLELERVTVGYGETVVARDIDMGLGAGRLGCLLGPSGCGKTTLLRAVAGFEPVWAGAVRLAGRTVSGPGRSVAPERRSVGMVFQDFALFPHLSIADNLGFGLKGVPRSERRRRVAMLLELVGLPGYGARYPHQLSGGQQQRVAIARALAPKPSLLLLDEPFSSLDVDLRESLAREVREILKSEGITALMVTHDQHEAFAWADEIGVMEGGRIAQWDSAYNLYHRPADRFVADFIGRGVLLAGTVAGPQRVDTELGPIEGEVPGYCRNGCPVEVLIRPDDVVDSSAEGSGVAAEVVQRAFRGADFLYTLRLPSGAPILCQTLSHHYYDIGATMHIQPEVDHGVVFAKEGPPAPSELAEAVDR